MTEDIQRYKDNEKRSNLLKDPEWNNSISTLKNFQYTDDGFHSVFYKKGKQTKKRKFLFHAVQYLGDTYSFKFIRYEWDYLLEEPKWDEVDEELTLKDTEVINYEDDKHENYMPY